MTITCHLLALPFLLFGLTVLTAPAWGQAFTPPPNSGSPSSTLAGGSR